MAAQGRPGAGRNLVVVGDSLSAEYGLARGHPLLVRVALGDLVGVKDEADAELLPQLVGLHHQFHYSAPGFQETQVVGQEKIAP